MIHKTYDFDIPAEYLPRGYQRLPYLGYIDIHKAEREKRYYQTRPDQVKA